MAWLGLTAANAAPVQVRVARRSSAGCVVQRCRMSSLAAVTGHGGTVPNFINGQFVESKTDRFIDCINPVRNPAPAGAGCL